MMGWDLLALGLPPLTANVTNTVSLVLLEPRWPSVERLEALVGKGEDRHERDAAQRRNADAKRVMGSDGVPRTLPGDTPYNRACSALIQHILRDGWGTDKAAAFLESRCTAPGVIAWPCGDSASMMRP